MNKQEKLIVVLLGLVLAGWLWHSFDQSKKEAAARAEREAAQAEIAATNTVAVAEQAKKAAPAAGTAAPAMAKAPELPKPAKPHKPEQTVVLSNAEVAVTLSSHGAVVKNATPLRHA